MGVCILGSLMLYGFADVFADVFPPTPAAVPAPLPMLPIELPAEVLEEWDAWLPEAWLLWILEE